MHKYSIWIIPEKPAYDELADVIYDLAATYDEPTFSPHITLCGNVQSTDENVERIVREAAESFSPFELEFGPVEFSTTYFQCVLVRVKTSAKLINLHLAIKHAFAIEQEHVYMPHMSLLYSNMDMQGREAVMRVTAIRSVSAPATAITIVRADSPDPKTWGVFATIPLT